MDIIIKNERGVTLVFVLMLLSVLTLMGITALITSNTEVQIATNLNVKKSSFYVADGGLELGTEILNGIIDTRGVPVIWDEIVQNDDAINDIVTELTIFNAAEGDTPDVITSIGTSNVNIDLDFTGRMQLPGSSSEFGGGYEGLGMGSQGGFANIYRIRSWTSGNTGAAADLGGNVATSLENGYRKTMGVGG